MNYYEDMVIIDSNLDDTAVEETIQKIKDVIIKQGGEVIKAEVWGRRKLAYELNKHQKGNYVLLVFKAPASTIAELENQSRVLDSIIKFMVVKLIKKKQIEAATAVPQKATVKEIAVETKAEETTEAVPQPEEKENVQ
ncbi:MAG: 30S ribosomal protein S6 [Nitrospirae bacterium]|nr:30S ribosomal protein S6 [Nitrospirota bacterium]